MEVTRVFDILDNLKVNSSKTDILSSKENKKWVSHSVADFVSNVNDISSGLLALGLQKNDIAALMSNNRPEWNFIDLALQQIGVISVPMYPTITVADYGYIFDHAEVKII